MCTDLLRIFHFLFSGTYHNSSRAQNCEMCGNDMWIENEKERPPREEQSDESKTSSSSSSSSSTKNILPKQQQLTREILLLPFVEQALIAATSSSSSSTSTSVSLLSSLYDYVLHRTPQLHRVCVVCDHPHMTFLNDCGSTSRGGTTAGGMVRNVSLLCPIFFLLFD